MLKKGDNIFVFLRHNENHINKVGKQSAFVVDFRKNKSVYFIDAIVPPSKSLHSLIIVDIKSRLVSRAVLTEKTYFNL